MWPDEEAQIKDDYPKFSQHALRDGVAASVIARRNFIQRVRTQEKQLKDNKQDQCAGNKRYLFLYPIKV